MFKTLRDAWGIPELRKKLMFTVIALLIYRLVAAIPVPFIDTALMAQYFELNLSNTILGFYNTMAGNAFSQASVLALGIQPYINASIIIQLLTIAIPALERMAKEEGEEGKKKINRITRWVTVALGILLGFAYYTMIKNQNINGTHILAQDGGFLTAVNLACLNRFEDGAVVDAAALIEAGVLSACPYGLKVLSNGNLTKKITVKAAAFSESAKEKIEQAGGKAEVV